MFCFLISPIVNHFNLSFFFPPRELYYLNTNIKMNPKEGDKSMRKIESNNIIIYTDFLTLIFNKNKQVEKIFLFVTIFVGPQLRLLSQRDHSSMHHAKSEFRGLQLLRRLRLESPIWSLKVKFFGLRKLFMYGFRTT